MGAISFSGLGSGIDIQSIVTALVDAEKAPKQNSLDRQETDVSVTLTGLGNLKSALEELRTTVFDLSLSSNYGKRSVTTSSNEFFNASVTGQASTGNYNIEVVQLAKGTLAQSQVFTGGSSTTFGDGTLTFTLGSNSFNVEVSSTDTLEDIRNKINDATGNTFVNANLLNNVTKGVDTGSILSIQSSITGAGNDLVVSYTGDAALAQLSDNLTQEVAASDAQIKIDGLTATSDSNTFENVIQDVTLTVTKENTPGETESLSIELDKNSTRELILAFVETYNAFSEVTRSLGSADVNEPGLLVGDYTLRQISSKLRNLLSSPVDSVNGDFNSLSSIGISTTSTGDLEIDDNLLDKALNENFGQFEALFTGTDGFATQLKETIDQYTGSGGIINSRLDSLNQQLERIADERLSLDRRIQDLELRLTKQFAAMDAIVAQFNSTQSYVAQQFASLPGFGKQSKD
jgi:flagellar hook-associated protein 2